MESMGDPSAVVLGSGVGTDKVALVAAFSPAVVKAGLNAGSIIGASAKICGGGGGGRPNLAQVRHSTGACICFHIKDAHISSVEPAYQASCLSFAVQ